MDKKDKMMVDIELVDLGLQSGTLWAKMNIGAEKETDYGKYFQWGETDGHVETCYKTQHQYGWDTYFDTTDESRSFIKYNNHGGLQTLESIDDAATVANGEGYRMPTKADFEELLTLKNEWVENYQGSGVNGRLFHGTNGNSLFFPASGGCLDGDCSGVGACSRVWSSSLSERYEQLAYFLRFYSDEVGVGNSGRRCGFAVRPVSNHK